MRIDFLAREELRKIVDPWCDRWLIQNTDPDYLKWCRQQYSDARAFLKRCGKPNDEWDREIIDMNKLTATVYARYV